jgi:hypothetical protein
MILGSLLVITLLLFLVRVLFSGKCKPVRGIVWTLSVISLLFYGAMSFNHKSVSIVAEKEMVGLYKLDTINSIYHSKKLKDKINIILELKSDNTFEINNELPFFYSTAGSWTYFDNGDMSGIRGKFDKSGNEFEIYDTPNSMSFSRWFLKDGDEGDEIIFERQ